jgi:hypothetical protein
MGAVKHLKLSQIKEVAGSVISGAKDMLEKGTAETEDLVLKIARPWSKTIRLTMLL